MKPVLINGFLYWWDGEKVWNEDKTSYSGLFSLTINERMQLDNCLKYEADKARVQTYLIINNVKS